MSTFVNMFLQIYRRIIYLSVLFTSVLACHSQQLISADTLASVAGLDLDNCSVYVEEISTGSVLADYNADIPLIPASITKAVTTAAVCKLHSVDTRFNTTVLGGEIICDSVMNGNLKIMSYGDPTLGSHNFHNTGFCNAVADSLYNSGVRVIYGDIEIDSKHRVPGGVPRGWLESDLTKVYGAVYRPVNYADNRLWVSYPTKESSPVTPDIEFSISKSKKRPSISKNISTNSFHITGNIKKGSASGMFANSSPEKSIIAELKRAIERRGITISENKSTNKVNHLFSFRSPSYSEIMRSLMVRSDNLLAEAMLRTLSPSGSLKDALNMERIIFPDAGYGWEGVSINDGSGLSRLNRLTAYFMADILLEMAQSEEGAVYTSLFPRAGKEGTVKRLLADTALEGQLALKSGSMSGVCCYAGYKIDSLGLPTHVVVVMVNNFNGNRNTLRSAIGDMLLEIFSNFAEYDDRNQ